LKKRQRASEPPTRTQRLGLFTAVIVVLAFIASFVLGLGHGPSTSAVTSDSAPPPIVVQDARARVEVMNAAGKAGLAKLATEQLRDAGFDVVQFGNAATTSPASSIIDRAGKRAVATAIGEALGIATVRTQVDASRYVDATVIIGKDWPPKKVEPEKKSWQDRLLRR